VKSNPRLDSEHRSKGMISEGELAEEQLATRDDKKHPIWQLNMMGFQSVTRASN
jgi:hypothetical protein